MRLEKYGHGSHLMQRMNLPTGFFYLWENDFRDLDFEDDDVFVIYQFSGPKHREWYHVSFRKDVFNDLQGKSILACEILGFDEHCNALELPNMVDLKFVRELRREKQKAKRALFYEIDLEMKLRSEMRTTLKTTPCLVSKLCRNDQATSIFIMGLPTTVDEQQIFDLCSEQGDVVGIDLQRDKMGASLGVTFVTFATQKQACQALRNFMLLSRAWMNIGHRPLKVGFWKDGDSKYHSSKSAPIQKVPMIRHDVGVMV